MAFIGLEDLLHCGLAASFSSCPFPVPPQRSRLTVRSTARLSTASQRTAGTILVLPLLPGEAMSTDIGVRLQNLIDQAIKETDSEKLEDLVEEIYRLLEARTKELKQ